MAWTAPRTWVAAEVVTAALLNTHVRDNLKAIGDPWTTYTPTYTGLVIGNAVVTTKYLQAGKLVIGEVKIVFGSSSSFSALFTITMPTTIAVQPNLAIGSAFLVDTSSSAIRSGTVVTTSSTAVAFVYGDGSANITNAAPWTWATGDTLSFSFTYEAA